MEIRYAFEGVPGWEQVCFEEGLKKWAGVNNVTIVGVQGGDSPNLVIKDATNKVSTWYAEFVPTGSDGSQHFTHGEILLHGSYDGLTSCLQWQSVGMHEMGHGFGLDDLDGAAWGDTVMGGQMDDNLLNQDWEPNACDRQRGEDADTFIGPGAPPMERCTKSNGDGRTDNSGCCNLDLELQRSPSQNMLPVGHIMAPLNNTALPTGSNGVVKLDTLDVDGSVYRADWFLNNTYIATTWAPNLNLSFSNAPAGVHTIKAAIYDTAQEYAWTQTITLNVGSYYAPDTLSSGSTWPAGWALVSANSAYYATLTASGNFTLFTAAGVPVASTGTSGAPSHLTMHTNGNFTVSLFPSNPQVAWQTGTGGVPNVGAGLRVLNNGKVAVIRRDGTTAWQYP